MGKANKCTREGYSQSGGGVCAYANLKNQKEKIRRLNIY
jgi:hypothetical protein